MFRGVFFVWKACASGKRAVQWTKFAADTHSVTITSGTISFNSNTFAVNSDNLTVTNTGLVTSKNFIAKNLFQIVNNSNVVLASIQTSTNGGLIAVGKTDTSQVGTLWATANGGFLALADGSQNTKLTLAGNTGTITANGGATFGGGVVCGGLTAKTQIVAANNAGTSKVFFAATDTYGYGAFKNANGDNNIYLRGDSGDIECVSIHVTDLYYYTLHNLSSRKVKENIKPIEDSEKILDLQAVSFDYKDKKRGTDKRGFIAEDVEKILPNLVTEETEETPASIDYVSMIPYLQDIIKKQEKRIQALEEKLNAIMEEKEK